MPIDPQDFLPLHANWFHILLSLVGKDLADYSLDTVKMFADDAAKSGFTL